MKQLISGTFRKSPPSVSVQHTNRCGTPHSLCLTSSMSSALKTLQNTEADPDDPQSADQADTAAAKQYFLCESRSEYVTSDNPEYSIIQHLSGS